MRKLIDSFLHLVYPPLCLHCEESLEGSAKILCENCFHLLELIDTEGRCPFCLNLKISSKKGSCVNCFSKKRVLKKIGATFHYKGVAVTLIKKFKYGNMPYLGEAIAAFMAGQFLELNFPLPDLIIPIPQSLSRFLIRKYNQAELLSLNLGKLLNVPVQNSLKRKSGDYSQAALNQEERLNLSKGTIILKENQNLEGKTLLLVDDVFTTGTTLRLSAEVLHDGFPKEIYGLTACYASTTVDYT